VLRSSAPLTSITPSVTAALGEVNRNIIVQFQTLPSMVRDSLLRERLMATLSGFFGALAVLLATIGLYGVMAYTVARRRNEIGVRIALGAEQSRVVRMVLGEVAGIVIAGVVVGVALSLGVTRLVTSFLYGMKPTDPGTLAASAVVLVLVGLAAAALPARRAATLDPVAALREE